jgi:hypothetical protein
MHNFLPNVRHRGLQSFNSRIATALHQSTSNPLLYYLDIVGMTAADSVVAI